jgi:hypothetical protein
MDYLVVMQKFLTYDDVPHIKQYIKSKQWWDTIDGFDRIVGNIAFTDSRINPQWVKTFIEKYKDKMNKLSIKEASKYI